jgi:Asp-tRNA(Asn)/Glu-tRNA(Gln) amidotransferase B subunit
MFKLFARHHHHVDDPWTKAPPSSIELREILGLLVLQMERNQMATQATLDKLTAAIAANTAETKTLIDALNASNGNDDAAINAAADAIAANTATMATALPQAPAV